MTPSPDSLGRHVAPALDEARLERQVAAIAARVEARPPRAARRRRVVVFALATMSVGALVVGAGAWRARTRVAPAATSPAGTTFEASAGGETITLADGSRAVLDARSKLTLVTVRPDLVHVALERGGVDLDVVHAEGKRFVASARGYEIRVLGTRFSVRLPEDDGAPRLEVKVARGRVRVAKADDAESREAGADVRVLGAGETWSAALGPTAPVAPTPPAPPARAATAAHAAGAADDSARDLLARAEAYRAADEPRAAARLLDTLRLRHRADPRAGLAAFELGRLRLDRLGDPRGAAQAFADAVALAPDAPFRQDAEARLVEAYEGLGDRARCRQARAAFLARYPRSVHSDRIASRCAEPAPP